MIYSWEPLPEHDHVWNHEKPPRVKVFKSCRDIQEFVDLQLGTVPQYDHDVSPINLWSEHHSTSKSMMHHGPPAPNAASSTLSPISGAGHKLTLPMLRERSAVCGISLLPTVTATRRQWVNGIAHCTSTHWAHCVIRCGAGRGPQEPNRGIALDHRSTSTLVG